MTYVYLFILKIPLPRDNFNLPSTKIKLESTVKLGFFLSCDALAKRVSTSKSQDFNSDFNQVLQTLTFPSSTATSCWVSGATTTTPLYSITAVRLAPVVTFAPPGRLFVVSAEAK